MDVVFVMDMGFYFIKMKEICNNKFKIYFKDGVIFESDGRTNSVKGVKIPDEFKWVSYLISKELINLNRSLKEIDKITYTLNII